MPNANTSHSRALRQEGANNRIRRICNEGGKRLSVLIESEYVEMLDDLKQAYSRAGYTPTETDVIKSIIKLAHKQTATT